MTQEAPTPPRCEVLILTALPVEFQVVVAHLQGVREVEHPDTGTIYHQGSFPDKRGARHVAVAQIGMGGLSAASETERASNLFHPRIMLFVGIAGGLKDVRHGDVVVATKVYAYEFGKAQARFKPRPEVWRASYAFEQRARAEANNNAWLARLDGHCPDPVPRVHLGALAGGEKVLSDQRSSVYHFLQTTYGDSLAVEMEGHGFLQAVHANQNIYALVIRGISDLIDDKPAADAAGLQKVAARHAAAFAFQVLANFTLPRQGSSPSLPPTGPADPKVPPPLPRRKGIVALVLVITAIAIIGSILLSVIGKLHSPLHPTPVTTATPRSPSPIITVCCSPTPSSASNPTPTSSPGTVLLTANWSTGLNGWEPPDGVIGRSVWSASNGALVCDGSQSGGLGGPLIILERQQLPTSNYAIVARIQVTAITPNISGIYFGLLTRESSGGVGYMAGVGGDTSLENTIYEDDAANKQTRTEVSYNDAIGAWHSYRVEAKNNAIKLFIDSTFMFQESMQQNPFLDAGQNGEAGLACSGLHLLVSSFQVTAL